jgi:hypothetical protein
MPTKPLASYTTASAATLKTKGKGAKGASKAGGEGGGGEGEKEKTGHYAKSATLFRALQNEALGTIAGVWLSEAGGVTRGLVSIGV